MIPEAFLLNVKIFLVAELLILPFALLIAVLRSLPGPVFFPLRALAVVYTDLFRGIPTILVIYLLGFGVPPSARWLPEETEFWSRLGSRRARARLLGVRVGGLPRRDRLGAPEPGRRRALARPLARAARFASSCCPRRCGASSRRF